MPPLLSSDQIPLLRQSLQVASYYTSATKYFLQNKKGASKLRRRPFLLWDGQDQSITDLIEVKLEVEASANLHLASIAIAFDRAEEG
jgi:hypothetical protein